MSERLLVVIKRLWIVLFLAGIVGVSVKIATGERLAGYGSYVPWGLWIAVYFHAIGISGGVFAAGVVGYLRGVRGLKENLRVTLLVSAVSLVTGLLSIWLDLGKPFRAYRVILSPNFGSMLDFNAWMYGIFLALAALIFYLSLNKAREKDVNDRSGWLVPLLSLACLLSVAYPSQSGAFFGVVDAKPFWSSALLPVLFLTSAITSGASALIVVHYYLAGESAGRTLTPRDEPFYYLRKITLVGIMVYFLGEFSEYSLALWSPLSRIREAVMLVLFGSFWWVFWIIHVCGALSAIYLLVRGKTVHHTAAGAFIIVASFISTRLNILIPGQSIAELRGLREAFTHPRLSFEYVPTIFEYLITLFVVAIGLALFYFGLRLLRLFFDKKIGGIS